MNIFVTGGAGYIGSHAVKALLKQGHHVVVLDNLFRGHRQAVPEEAVFYLGDLLETDKIESILKKHAIDVVMHFAALTYVGESVQQPLQYYRNNTAGALSLLTAMQSAGVHRFIFSSTAATYGQAPQMPITEEMEQQPINPYGWSKWMVERILLDYSHANKRFGFTALRYFNVAGASSDATIGEDHTPETHLVPNIIFAALGKKECFTIFGTDYPTPDGTCIRDYVHIEDLISAHLLAMNALVDGCQRFYNLGIGHGYSVQEILNATEETVQSAIPMKEGPRREGDPAELYASSEKIQKELGWKPVHTDVHDLIQSAVQWHKTHPNGYQDQL